MMAGSRASAQCAASLLQERRTPLAPALGGGERVVDLGEGGAGRVAEVDAGEERGGGRALDGPVVLQQDRLGAVVVDLDDLVPELGERGHGEGAGLARRTEDQGLDRRVPEQRVEVHLDALHRLLARLGLGVLAGTQRAVEGGLVLLVADADELLVRVRAHGEHVEVDGTAAEEADRLLDRRRTVTLLTAPEQVQLVGRARVLDVVVLTEIGHDGRSNLSHVVRGRLCWCNRFAGLRTT